MSAVVNNNGFEIGKSNPLVIGVLPLCAESPTRRVDNPDVTGVSVTTITPQANEIAQRVPTLGERDDVDGARAGIGAQ
jgi:hypothetical protein